MAEISRGVDPRGATRRLEDVKTGFTTREEVLPTKEALEIGEDREAMGVERVVIFFSSGLFRGFPKKSYRTF